MRVLIVTNFTPDAATPQRGRWVIDQVEAIRAHGIEAEVFSFPLGRRQYPPAIPRLRRRLRGGSFDLVHAHYGLPGWVAKLAGAKPLVVTFHGTDVRHRSVGAMSRRLAPRIDLCAGVSRALFGPEGGQPGLPLPVGHTAVLPCGADLGRFASIPRPQARRELGLDPGSSYLLFPANPARPEKRYDRARQLADSAGVELLTGGGIEPDRMPLWLNAANAVVVTSDYEGFGLVALEALACGVPLLSTPVGIAPHAAGDVEGCLVAPFDGQRWLQSLRPHLDSADPRVEGAAAAAPFSAERMATRVLVAYEEVLELRK